MVQLDVVVVPTMLGGSQPPLTQTQSDAGFTVVQLLVVVVGGSQFPLTHVQPVPGEAVVQLVVVVSSSWLAAASCR